MPIKWKTASNPESTCVEMGLTEAEAFIRDTKNRDGGTLQFPLSSVQALVIRARNGEIDLS